MKRTLEFEAILDNSFGSIILSGLTIDQGLGTNVAIKANEKGEFSVEEGAKIVVKEVTYKASRNQPAVHFYDEEHRFTFKEYVQMGRPNVIKIKKTFEYF